MRAAFTLIELLVVVAIIAVIAGMLLSAVKLVRAGAESTKCQGALRQFGAAHQAYAEDHNGTIAPTCLTMSVDQNNWMTTLLPYLEQETLMGADVVVSDNKARRDNFAWACASSLRFYQSQGVTWNDGQAAWNLNQGQFRGFAYGQNLFPLAPASYISTIPGYDAKGQGAGLVAFAKVSRLAQRVLDTEATYCYVTGVPIPLDMRWAIPGYTDASNPGWGPARHHSGNNSLFFDMHVQSLPPNMVYQSTVDPAQVSL